MEKEYLEKLNKKAAHKTLAEAFETLIELRLGKLAFSTSFGQEDQVITDFIFKNNLPVSVFTLDTGRLFEETYEVYHKTLRQYKKPITPFFPNAKKVEALLEAKGPSCFYDSLANIKGCC